MTLGVIAVILVVVGLIIGDESSAAAELSTTSAAAPTPSAATNPSPAGSGAPFKPSDSQCAPAAASIVDSVQQGLTHADWQLTNGIVISASSTTYFGAQIVDQNGVVKEPSNVWIIRNGQVYASTGGARTNTTFPKVSAALVNISLSDELMQAVDNCVVNATLDR
ncbi:hypothetical protein AB0B25_17335 [Nocardia sp. NPDC049190]|uniref:hypothetical protein n=1 Tax=Nocardia sp. NPDC049190 TaxID=3155650 RepID=UPI0033CD70D0